MYIAVILVETIVILVQKFICDSVLVIVGRESGRPSR